MKLDDLISMMWTWFGGEIYCSKHEATLLKALQEISERLKNLESKVEKLENEAKNKDND